MPAVVIDYTLPKSSVILDDVTNSDTLGTIQAYITASATSANIANLYTRETYDGNVLSAQTDKTVFGWDVITIEKAHYHRGATNVNFQLSVQVSGATFRENADVIVEVRTDAPLAPGNVSLSGTAVYELTESSPAVEAIFTGKISEPETAESHVVDNGVELWYREGNSESLYFRKTLKYADYEHGMTNEVYTLTVTRADGTTITSVLAVVIRKPYTYVTTAFNNYIEVPANINLNISRDEDGRYGILGGSIFSQSASEAVYELPTGMAELYAGKMTGKETDGSIAGAFDVKIQLTADKKGMLTSNVFFSGESITATVEDNPLEAQVLQWPANNQLLGLDIAGAYRQGIGPSVEREDFALTVWVYMENTTSRSIIYDQGGYADGVVGYSVEVITAEGHTNALRLQYSDGGPCKRHYAVDNTIPLDTWTHVTVSVKREQPDKSAFYINGIQSGAGFSVPSNDLANAVATIGREDAHTGETFIGRLTDLAIWKRAVTPAEIAQVMKEGTQRFEINNPETGLSVFGWTDEMEDGSIEDVANVVEPSYALSAVGNASLTAIPLEELSINGVWTDSTRPDVLSATLTQEQAERYFSNEIKQLKALYTRNLISSWQFDITPVSPARDNHISQYADENERSYPEILREGEKIVLETTYPYTVTVVDINGVTKTIVPPTTIHAVVEQRDMGLNIIPNAPP